MRLVHTDSGLGNQMLDYAEYLAIRQSNPEGEIYLEDFLYDLPDDRPGMFSQWNGYELDRIFGIEVPRFRDLLSAADYQKVLQHIEDSRFWEKGWNYAPAVCEALRLVGYPIENSYAIDMTGDKPDRSLLRRAATAFFRTMPGYHVKRTLRHAMAEGLVAKENNRHDPFQCYPDNVLIGHSLVFRYKGFHIERIEEQLRKDFSFPDIMDEKNRKAMDEIQSCNAVAIHARRSDMLFVNGYCYRYGYFKRAVDYIRKHTENPVFYFFTDEKSVGWCQENEDVFGLDFEKDQVRFVNWNKGKESFRDMQLMAACHHNIFTESSFGFWGAYFNEHPDKITCAPDPIILATNDF